MTDGTHHSRNDWHIKNYPASGFLWGDYEGLTAIGQTFYGVFTGQSNGRATSQLDPIFFKESAQTNQPPNCSSAVSNIPELWPPNHKFVSIDILGVTDPDGDPVTSLLTASARMSHLKGLEPATLVQMQLG